MRRIFNSYLAHREMNQNVLKCRSRPYSIHFLSQAQCNYNCEFCAFDYRTNPVTNQLTLDKFKVIFRNLHPHLLNEIVFSGQGEPLLCNDLDKIIKYVKDITPHISIGIITNGLLIKGRNLELLAQYSDHVIVSLHSVHTNTYKQMTSIDACEEVINNLFALRKRNPHLPITLYFAYSMRNIDEIKKHLQLVAKLGNCTFSGAYAKFYSYKSKFSDRTKQNLHFTLDKHLSLFNHQIYSDQRIEEAMQYAKRNNIRANFPPLFKIDIKKRRNCCWGYTDILVDYDGTIFPCCNSEVVMYESITSKQMDFGNLLADDIDNIWNNKHFLDLRYSSAPDCKNRTNPRCENCTTLEYLTGSGNIEKSHFIER